MRKRQKNTSLLNVYYFLACENSLYGIECNSTCGHCSSQNDCFHENGTCFNGCELGYSGDLCQNGKVNTKYFFLIIIVIQCQINNIVGLMPFSSNIFSLKLFVSHVICVLSFFCVGHSFFFF